MSSYCFLASHDSAANHSDYFSTRVWFCVAWLVFLIKGWKFLPQSEEIIAVNFLRKIEHVCDTVEYTWIKVIPVVCALFGSLFVVKRLTVLQNIASKENAILKCYTKTLY